MNSFTYFATKLISKATTLEHEATKEVQASYEVEDEIDLTQYDMYITKVATLKCNALIVMISHTHAQITMVIITIKGITMILYPHPTTGRTMNVYFDSGARNHEIYPYEKI